MAGKGGARRRLCNGVARDGLGAGRRSALVAAETMVENSHTPFDRPPLGPPVPRWSPRPQPPDAAMHGRYCRVEPIDSARHGEALYAAYAEDRQGRLWTYLPWGPYSGPEELCARIDAVRASGVRPEYALIDLASDKPFGQASYLNIDPAAGSIEVGGIVFAPAYQRGTAATEAMYLMMRHAFDELGYRRYAWQCNSLNARSRASARRNRRREQNALTSLPHLLATVR